MFNSYPPTPPRAFWIRSDVATYLQCLGSGEHISLYPGFHKLSVSLLLPFPKLLVYLQHQSNTSLNPDWFHQSIGLHSEHRKTESNIDHVIWVVMKSIFLKASDHSNTFASFSWNKGSSCFERLSCVLVHLKLTLDAQWFMVSFHVDATYTFIPFNKGQQLVWASYYTFVLVVHAPALPIEIPQKGIISISIFKAEKILILILLEMEETRVGISPNCNVRSETKDGLRE